MTSYLLRRLLYGLVTLILITFVIFALIRNMPGTPLTIDLAELDPSRQISQEDLERLEQIYGLDKHWSVAYFQWLGNLAKFDMGRSFREKRPVTEVIGERIGPTLVLSVTSLFLAYILAVPMGLFTSVRSGKTEERLLSTFLYMLYSVPSFVAALLLLNLFYVRLEGTVFQLPLGGMMSMNYAELTFTGRIWDRFTHMILPVFCATYAGLAYYSRFVKSNMEEVVRQDYIRTAKAKGVGPVRLVVHHAFRNTLIPFVTLMGLTLPGLLSGFVILESVFTWPGMGLLFLDSITNRDYPTIMGLTLMFSVLTLIGQLIADILYAFVDPRVTYS
ncbi:MAG TPA: ABC transporter permease [Acidobacteriota bacterium]|nr:ABC transporter permease [Acidobacteriota bacterium]